MAKRWTKTEAFAEYGTVCGNTRWSWSGRSPDGQTVALTFWTDGFEDFKARPIVYDDTGWNDTAVASRLGNHERMENIRWTREHLGGVVRVVMARAKDVNAQPREIDECWPNPNLIMRIIDFDEDTGEWRAESVEQG